MRVALIGMGASAFGSYIAMEEYEQEIDAIDIFSNKEIKIKEKNLFDNKSINSFYRTLKSKSLIT